ncbi:Vegetative incompatibility HET-E-1 [Fusarium acutatum]|uniref:Vegetative incompatibility HET-E-1 n=1 Tax=Fusarium acutatum TaxID=78861 RepID=A0A8H4JNB8_9HYPO|nr:Vegetative incompatibility HET-E-1 [Fusarium acutatum]
MSSPSIISPFTATTEPATVSSPSPEPQKVTPSVPERLWNKAYNILGEKEPNIVSSYQEILKLVHREWDDNANPEELQYLEHCKTVKSRQMWRLVYCGLEKSKRQAKYKENLSTIIEIIDNIKGVVEKAVKYSSEAAIAWAGILSNPMKEPGLNRKGIAYVLSRMEWYWNLAELVLQDNSSVPSAALRINLETQIIEFYKKLLLFQIRSACLYYRNWAGIILRDTVKLDDWSGELNTIKDAERLILKDIEQYDNQDIRLKLSTIEASAVGQAESLESICKILREEALSKEKNAQGDKDKECLRALLVTDPSVDKKRIQSQKGDPLKESYEWILKSDAYETFISDPSSRVLWINGPPGKGKTMLLCGIIDELQKSLRPISFFLCQANVKEEDLSSDIAVMRGLIYALLEHQPSLISPLRESYDKQKDKLFNSINSSELLRDILTKMLQDPCLHDTILIVDALDECNINRSKLTNLIVELSKSCNTKWIVSSRNWPEIHQELAAAMGLISLDLEKEHGSVSQAVKSYISKKVDDLARTKWKNDLELKEKVFDYMQSHADDTFLWAALVCERLANSGIRKRLVMEELVRFPMSLTALYQAMMDRITDSSEADRLKQILALVCVVHRPLTSAEIPTLVESMDDYDEHDVEDAIASCGSFLTLQDGEIFFVHQSAKEFLFDQGYEVLFPHGINHKHTHIFYRSLEAMENTLRQNIYELGSPGTLNPVEVPSPNPLCAIEYSCVYWAQHLCKSECMHDPDFLSLRKVLGFLQSRFTNWLEALSLMEELSTAITSILLLKTILADVQMQELTNFIHDAHRFIRHHKRAIEIAPLQVYCAALIFSPRSNYGTIRILRATTFRLIRKLEHQAEQCFFLPEGNNITLVYKGDVAVFNWKTGEAISRLNCIIEESSNIALLTATHIVGIFRDATEVKIWDLFTGDCKHHFAWDVGKIDSLACSSDGHQIAATSRSHIRLWHLDDTLGWVHKHDMDNQEYIRCLTFLENSRILISGSYDNLIRVWDETGGCVKVLKGHSQSINFLSVCGNQLASGCWDGTVKLWDLSDIIPGQLRQKWRSSVHTYDYSSQTFRQSSSSDKDLRIDNLLFSPAGSILASVSYEKMHIWDTATDICTDILLRGRGLGLNEASFTPDDKLVAMKDADGKLGVWDTDVMKQVRFSDLQGSGSVGISADGRYVLSLSDISTDGERVLKVWDLMKDPQTQQHIISEILPLEKDGKVTRFVHSEDWKVLAVFDMGELHVLHRKFGNWVKEQLPDPWGIPLAFSQDNTWLLTHNPGQTSFLIRKTTSPSIMKVLESLKADATPCDTSLLENPWWRIATPYGLLAIGEPEDFEGTARIGWGLSLGMDWIMRGNERMLWIPADYRRMALDINASRVAFVCPSGQIKIMRFR